MRKNVNSNKVLLSDRRLIRQRGYLNKIYRDFYAEFKKSKVPNGKLIEIGSGAGFIKEIIPSVITSDVVKGPDIDKVFFAEKIPFKSSSVAAFFMIDTLHHIKDVEIAFKEMERCLKRNGKIVMIEPYNSWWGYIIYKYLHYEHFDPKAGWKVEGRGRMSDSNTALPWIIFVRDRKIFQKKFPELIIDSVKPFMPITYLVSRGLLKPQLLPTFTYGWVKFIEKLFSPLNKYVGMFVIIELHKQKQRG